MKTIGYIRVSTSKQKLSISNQISEIKKWSNKNNNDVELIEIIQNDANIGTGDF